MRLRWRAGTPGVAFASVALVLAGASCVVGCYDTHQRGAGPGPLDAAVSADAASRDAHPRPRPPVVPAPGERCEATHGHMAAPCDAEFESACQRWMELAANGWYGHTTCDGFPRGARCGNGDFCPPGESCRCAAAVTCPVAYVCVSDTPDGPRWCRHACAE